LILLENLTFSLGMATATPIPGHQCFFSGGLEKIFSRFSREKKSKNQNERKGVKDYGKNQGFERQAWCDPGQSFW